MRKYQFFKIYIYIFIYLYQYKLYFYVTFNLIFFISMNNKKYLLKKKKIVQYRVSEFFYLFLYNNT